MANSRVMVAVVVVVVVIGLLSLGGSPVQAQQCPGLDVGGLISECERYVRKSGPKIPPSRACCGVVSKINVPCACKYVNKDIEKVVSVEKAVYVAQYCGLSLHHGFKCGSYTIP